MSEPAPRISVIMPALNESGTIGAALARLQPLRGRGHEIIVVDGGSADDTPGRCGSLADRVIMAGRGRARQMHAGVGDAAGDILWFLHADTLAPVDADRHILDAIGTGLHEWGRFDVDIRGNHPLLKVVGACMNLRSRLTGIATGDQGIFVSRAAYAAAGGYPDIPLMEDIAISRALRRRSSPACLRVRLQTSARRWRTHGMLRTVMLMWALRLACFLGVPPERLARYYASARP